MITVSEYFGKKPHSDEDSANCETLLHRVNTILDWAHQDGAYCTQNDPDTCSQISGSKGGSGDGGFRLPDSKTGAIGSKHKSAMAVDVYDPYRKLAAWCLANKDKLFKIGLWCEDFRWTPTWCHFQSVPPKSGKRVYIPSNSPPKAPALDGQKPVPTFIRT